MTSAHPLAPPPPGAPRRVVVVDRQPLDRDLLARALDHADGVAVALVTATLTGSVPDVGCDAVVVRASAPGTDLPAEVARATALPGRPRVVVLAGYVDAYLVERLEAVGADAVASSEVSLAGLLALLGGAPATPVPRPADRRELGLRHRLTPRELEILDHLADGLAPGQIAALLEIRVSTIRDHVKSLRAKLGCTSATQLVVTAHRLGLTPHLDRPLP